MSDQHNNSSGQAVAVDAPNQGDVETRLTELTAQVASLDDALLRTKAELQNVQRRSATERADAVRYGNADLVKSLLPTYDDLQRTLDALPSDETNQPLAGGVRLALDNFMKALREQGVEPIDAVGQRFDPQLHNALMQESSNDVPAGAVLKQIARGFRLRDRVIRPAMVIVSRGPDA